MTVDAWQDPVSPSNAAGEAEAAHAKEAWAREARESGMIDFATGKNQS